jgi:hypothetical protein
LVSGLDNLVKTGLKKPKKDSQGQEVKDANGNIVYEDIFDPSKIEAIKTVVEELKSKGAKVDLTETNTKLDEVKSTVEGVKLADPGTNY